MKKLITDFLFFLRDCRVGEDPDGQILIREEKKFWEEQISQKIKERKEIGIWKPWSKNYRNSGFGDRIYEFCEKKSKEDDLKSLLKLRHFLRIQAPMEDIYGSLDFDNI